MAETAVLSWWSGGFLVGLVPLNYYFSDWPPLSGYFKLFGGVDLVFANKSNEQTSKEFHKIK